MYTGCGGVKHVSSDGFGGVQSAKGGGQTKPAEARAAAWVRSKSAFFAASESKKVGGGSDETTFSLPNWSQRAWGITNPRLGTHALCFSP